MATEYATNPLGAVARVRSGYAFKSLDMGEIGAPLIKIRNIDPPRVNTSDCQRVPLEVIKEVPDCARYELAEGDILIAMTGATVGKVGRMPATSETHYLNQRVGKVYLVDDSAADYDFLYYVLSQGSQVRQMFGAADGSAQANISGTLIEQLEIPLPPLPRQRAIADILGTLDDKIELNRRMNRTLEAIAQAIFKSWFVNFDPVYSKANGREPVGMDPETAALFPDSFEDSPLGRIPEGWEIKTLGEVISLEYGKALKASVRQPGSVPVYGSNGRVGWHSKALVSGPGIVVGRKGNPGTVTWVAEAFFPIDTTFYVVPADEPLSLRYLYHALRIQDLPALAADSAVPGLNRNIAYENKLILPSVQLLGAFEFACTALAARVETNVGESKTLAQARDVLLPRLLAGEMEVHVDEGGIE